MAMDTNGYRTHRFSGGNGRIRASVVYRDGGVWVFKPKTVRNNLVLYGKVVSLRHRRRVYDVKKEQVGAYQFNYSCTCLGSFLGRYLCRHIAQFRLAEGETVRANDAADPRHY